MPTWKVLFLWMLPCYQAGNDGMFECGAHGRFEYCIDDIPGCVIGCHCHPGYYFDTETKICEPNSKLTHNYRRQYIPEPTRVQNLLYEPNIAQTESLPTLTTHNIIDEHVNDITKNADDLGDWLYNQFFKTIENQVINNTNKEQLTRRSSRDSLLTRGKLRRARRKGSKHKKRKKSLKGKLLRIAEDDSLFQSSESSDSESGNADLERSDSSLQSDSDEDHGHKKILLINKKPKPPLPSFIFLPNMNTAYYPPIGLPPPPVMPMYPMIPVPPMLPAPPLLPCSGQLPECEESTTTVSTEKITTLTTRDSTTEISTITDTVITTAAEITITESATKTPAIARSRGRKRNRIKSLEHMLDEDEELPPDINETNREGRQRLLNLLRQRIKYPRLNDPPYKRHRKPIDKYMNKMIPPDDLMVNGQIDELPMDEKFPPTNLENTSELENVDFKYLSQLIHRVNESQVQDMPMHDTNLEASPKAITPRNRSNNRYHDFTAPLNSGRRTSHNVNTSRIHQMDDSYYSNLGRQIATLIRTIDADKERQFNIEIEKVPDKNYHPYFNENGPRTFWERSVRSPLRFFHSFRNKFDNPKTSNELLFNIENKVETIASTIRPLSLHELENLINVMKTARTEFQRNANVKNIKPVTKMLNVNLWPQELKESKKSIKPSNSPKSLNIKRRKASDYSNIKRPNIVNAKTNIIDHNFDPFTNKVKIYKSNNGNINREVQKPLKNITKMYIQQIHEPKELKSQHFFEKRPHIMNPTILNYKNIKKYFFDNNNQYSFQNDDLRLNYLPASESTKQKLHSLIPSPYFHHEVNHIDYLP